MGARQIGRGIHPHYWITCGFPLSNVNKGCLYLIEKKKSINPAVMNKSRFIIIGVRV